MQLLFGLQAPVDDYFTADDPAYYADTLVDQEQLAHAEDGQGLRPASQDRRSNSPEREQCSDSQAAGQRQGGCADSGGVDDIAPLACEDSDATQSIIMT